MRIDKYIATSTAYSRKEIKQLLKQGRIHLNQQAIHDSHQHIAVGKDHITLDKVVIKPKTPRYFMLHKPKGVVCANHDNLSPTVIDLLHETHKEQLQIAGRLDKDTTGLVLLTDDGQWNHRITSPKKHCYKIYRVGLASPMDEAGIAQLTQGVLLHGESKPTHRAIVKVIAEQCIELSIREGRYHQVKRMMAAINNHVTTLHRLQIGNITLDPTLRQGQYRPLTMKEIAWCLT